MFKKIAISIGVILAVGVLALFTVGSVYAQGPNPPLPEAPLGNAWGRVCNGAGVVSEAIASLLGMTPEELYAERSGGKTLSDLAAEKGITDQQLIDAIVEGRTEAINQALTDGRITQEQADWMLENMETNAPLMIDRVFGQGRMGSGMRGFGGGMQGFGRGCGSWGTPNGNTVP